MNLQESIKNHRLMWDKVISIMEIAKQIRDISMKEDVK